MSAATSSRKPLFWALGGAAVVVAVVVIATAVVVATGHGGTPRAIGLKNIPLPAGTSVMAQVRSCDRGVNAYCALEVVIVGRRYQSSAVLRTAYQRQLTQLGWTAARGPDGNELAADSPGHELRLTYATAYGELLGIDSTWIERAAPISHSLSDILFDRAPRCRSCWSAVRRKGQPPVGADRHGAAARQEV